MHIVYFPYYNWAIAPKDYIVIRAEMFAEQAKC